MNALRSLFAAEPALVVGLVSALVTLAVAFGVQLTPDQTHALLAVAGAVMALGAFIVRGQVTPNATVAAQLATVSTAPVDPTPVAVP